MTISPTTRSPNSRRPGRCALLAGGSGRLRQSRRSGLQAAHSVGPGREALGRRRAGAKRRESGFTLMELLLVVMIVSGLAALVWPQLARFSRSLAVRAAARDLVAVMGRARLEALSRREPVEVRFRTSSVTVVRPQPRVSESESSLPAGSAPSASARSASALPASASSASAAAAAASRLTGSLAQESEEVTVLEYPLGKSVAWSRLQVLAEKRDVIPQEQQLGLGQGLSAASFEEEAVTVTFYPDGTSDDALIGVGERPPGGVYDATTASAEVRTDYVIRVRGLVARAMVLRAADQSDEDYFAEVPDALASLAD